MDHTTLDPQDWEAFRQTAYTMLDEALNTMMTAREGRVWTPMPAEMKEALNRELPSQGIGPEAVQEKISALLPYGVGNTHPRFFGWVHGAGSPGCLLAEIGAAAMNANLGGRDHGAIHVEKQVLEWCREMMGFPEGSSGLLVSGTSMATVIALKTARDQRLGVSCRAEGLGDPGLVGYASAQAHSCLQRAFDLLGLGSDALRPIPCDPSFQLDLGALKRQIHRDREQGLTPFLVIGTAGSVNLGAIDDLDALADIAVEEELWFHIDGAFGATAILADDPAINLNGLDRADSLAFDFHKWLHVNYDAGCILIRSAKLHLQAFSGRAEYLQAAGQGLAAGNPWPVDFGPELSRGFRALKVWAHLQEHGTDKLGAAIRQNCAQARYLGSRVAASPDFELLAPVLLNIVCFRFTAANPGELDELNQAIVIQLQESGTAAPSTTQLHGRLAIRVNLTNHRTETADLDLLLQEAWRLGRTLGETA
ncbi:pyridoxal phosphate-dependent decarboxylase family protein [Desulfogranum mediterraneum]|uniref:pyridoxal phosphate-dependent decarboxylase family protein n=1 Tax=Desulfogranum mediterraneum TaxID=160661 RepID=UPI00040C442A|nr:pyridoxal-dependent decarboxylase [Desulfogranum mediterraneum]